MHVRHDTPQKGQAKVRRWESLRTGDLVLLRDGENIPADLVLLKCSDEQVCQCVCVFVRVRVCVCASAHICV